MDKADLVLAGSGGRIDVAPPPDNGTESTPGRFNIGLFSSRPPDLVEIFRSYSLLLITKGDNFAGHVRAHAHAVRGR
ncbi:hypothetical protein [Streptomyces yaizuensis]|uniref:Uncharacterized protein n=1 Tax=Streptomyces yaizuensis TaxID=2989713 RepID=A0ABQ5P7Y2_9ACTN|nr:hypothetical protein [Streptomyces sp. YSPA8]GLF98701.1 hypothetical protein SYYSPA8_30410 [Streptomyces sp. YSPA8]